MTQPQTNTVVDAKPNTVPIVPSDWATLGAKSGYDPKSAEDLWLYIVGPYNEGKSTFDASIQSNFILDAENGANAIVGSNSIRFYIPDYKTLTTVVKKLVDDTKEGKRHWNRVSWDTIEEFIDMIKHQLEEEKGVEDIMEYGSRGHGVSLVLNRFWSLVMDLVQAGYVPAFVGHQKVVTETNPVTKKDETKLRESVWPSIASKIKNKVDFQLTIYRLSKSVGIKVKKKLDSGQVIEVPTGKSEIKNTYYADCLTTSRGEGKSRGVPGLETKFEIPLIDGWGIFKSKYETAVEAAKKKYQ